MAADIEMLLVEDSAGDARLIQEMLRFGRRPGFGTTTATNLETALATLAAQPFDVVLLDLDLPDSRGLETIRSFRERAPDSTVVVLTGLDDEELGLEAVRLGAQEYLVKDDINAGYLQRTLQYAVERRRYQSQVEEARAAAAAAAATAAAAERARRELEIEVRRRIEAQEILQTNVDRLEALRQIDLAIIGNITLAPTLEVLLHQVVEKLDVAAANILLYRTASAALVPVASKGFHTDLIRRRRPKLDEGVVGRAAAERTSVTVRDAGREGSGFAERELLAREDLRGYHAVPLLAKGRLLGLLEVFRRTPLEPDPDWLSYCETLAGQAAIAVENAQLFARLRQANQTLVLAYDSTIEGWAHALELRDHETEGHSRRVTDLTVQLARHLGVGESELVHIRRGSLLHDIGKIGVPDSLLMKPGRLTEREWAVMKRHPAFAYDLLKDIRFLDEALSIPYCHHERWDGNGYPRGLAESEIPFPARIFAVVDVYDALTSARPYRPAWREEQALRYIGEQAGSHFDPRVVRAFLQVMATSDLAL